MAVVGFVPHLDHRDLVVVALCECADEGREVPGIRRHCRIASGPRRGEHKDRLDGDAGRLGRGHDLVGSRPVVDAVLRLDQEPWELEAQVGDVQLVRKAQLTIH